MLKKLKIKSKKINRSQTNYINNRRSLINIERLNMKLENAFWSGLIVGALGGLFTALWLMNDKSEKKTTENK